MDGPMAGFAGRQLGSREAPHAVLAMDTDTLFLDDVPVTGRAVDGVEPAPMPPVISADMALQALRGAVRRQVEVTEVVVTFEAGIDVFC